MFFKKIIQNKIKFLAVLLFVIGVFEFGTNTLNAEQTITNPTLIQAGMTLQNKTDTWTNFDGSKVNFDTSQKNKGLTAGGNNPTGEDSNTLYATRSANQGHGVLMPGILYYIGTGIVNGYTVTSVYDGGDSETSANDDYLREVRVKAPDGTEKVYIWTGGGTQGTISKEGNGKPGLLTDKDVLNAIGADLGINNLYQSTVDNSGYTPVDPSILDAKNMSARVQQAFDVGRITEQEKNDMLQKIADGTVVNPNDPKMIDLISRVNSAGADVYIDHSLDLTIDPDGNIITATTLTSKVEDAAATKTSELNSAGFYDGNDETTVGFCVIWDRDGWTSGYSAKNGANLSNCFAQVLYALLYIVSFILGIVGFFFNSVFEITVINMKANVDNLNIINTGWATIRDFANILFIFMLLYLAISTILQLDDHGVKRGLSRLIVGAVLINFSLFFVKIPIDVSNILAIEIYNKINPVAGSGEVLTAGRRVGLGDAIMSMFSPQQVFKDNTNAANNTAGVNLDPASTVKYGNINKAQWNLKTNPVSTFVMAIIIIFTATLVFLAVCIIFIKRFITLIVLMVFSPLAFAGMAVPNHNIEHQISSSFWSSLLKESFYAPVFMFMIYLTIKTGQSLNTTSLVANGVTGWDTAKDWGITLPVTNIISYSVVMGMMIFSLTVSETMGVKGAAAAIKTFDGARGWTTNWAARNTIGRAADTLINKTGGLFGQSDRLAKWATGVDSDGNKFKGRIRGSALGQWAIKKAARSIVGTATNLGKDFREKEVGDDINAFKSRIEEAHGNEQEIAKIFLEAGQRGISSSMLQAADSIFHGLSAKTKAGVKLHMQEEVKQRDKVKRGEDGKPIESDKDYQKRVGMDMEAGEKIDDFEQRVLDTKINKDSDNGGDKAIGRYYNDHDGGGRLETPEITEVDRLMKSALPFWDAQFRDALKDVKDDYELDADGKKIKEGMKKAANMEKVLERFQSHEQLMSALKSLRPSERAMFEESGDKGDKLRGTLSRVMRDKWTNEAAYADAGKNPLFGQKLKETLAAPVWDMQNTFALYSKLTSEGVEKNAAVMDEFIKQLGKVKSMEDDLATYERSGKSTEDKEALRKAYEEKRSGEESSGALYAGHTNAERMLVKGNKVLEDTKKIQALIAEKTIKKWVTDFGAPPEIKPPKAPAAPTAPVAATPSAATTGFRAPTPPPTPPTGTTPPTI